jgi:hypothetical protein
MLLAKVQHACIDRGVSQTEAIEEGLRMWLATAKKTARPSKRAAPALQIADAADQIRTQLDRLSELAATLK